MLKYFSGQILPNLQQPSVTITPILKESVVEETKPRYVSPEVSVECIVEDQEEPVDLSMKMRRVQGWSDQDIGLQKQIYHTISGHQSHRTDSLQVLYPYQAAVCINCISLKADIAPPPPQ